MSARLNIVSALVLVALLESAHGGVVRKRRDTPQHGLQMSSSSQSSSATSILSSIMEERRPQAAVTSHAGAPRHPWRLRRSRCHSHPHQGSYQHQQEHQHRHQHHRCNHWKQQKPPHAWRRPMLNSRGPI